MKKFLSIIIPHYKETERDMFPLLSGIYGQLGTDFQDYEMLIVTDGGGTPPADDFLRLFSPMDIRLINLKDNGGPGIARQAGIDGAKGQYLMFCDADDCLHSVGVLDALMKEAEGSAADIITSDWLEQYPDGAGGYRYLTHTADSTWMHGKLLRRAFLSENGIRHHPDLRVHEDSYFLALASSVAKKTKHAAVLSYVWKYREESITRRAGGAYTYESFPTFVFAICEALKWEDGRVPGQTGWKVAQLALYVYFSVHSAVFAGPDRERYREETETVFSDGIRPFWGAWLSVPQETVAELYASERQKHFAGCVEAETFGAWLDRLGLERGEGHVL